MDGGQLLYCATPDSLRPVYLDCQAVDGCLLVSEQRGGGLVLSVQLAVHTLAITCCLWDLSVFYRLSRCRCNFDFCGSVAVNVDFSTRATSVPPVCPKEDTRLVQRQLCAGPAQSSSFSSQTQSDGSPSSVTLDWLPDISVIILSC